MTTNLSEAERKARLKQLLDADETDPELFEGLLPDNVLGDIWRISLEIRHEDNERRDYILSVLEKQEIPPDEVHRLCRS